jgi:hypothetical protein
MSQKISIGVKKILFQETDNTGTPLSVNPVQLGLTYKDSASFKEAAPGVFDVNVEESDDPVLQFFTKGKKTIAFGLIDYTPETIQSVKGGTVTNGAWSEPATIVAKEGILSIVSQTDQLMIFNRVSMTAVFNADLKKNAVALLDVTATPLLPISGGTPVVIGPYVSPIANAGADAAVVLATYTLQGVATAGSFPIDTKVWTCVTKPLGASTPGITTADLPHAALSGLVNGVYVYKWTLTDINGFVSSDTVTLTVNIP